MNCRHCHSPLQHVFLDLGFAPPSNAYLRAEQLHQPEKYWPLKLYVCDQCWLVQTEDYNAADDLFSSDYAYFSSVSRSWLDHAARYCAMITERLQLNQNSMVVELAANDGYLLQSFVAAGIRCLGVEPTASTAAVAESKNIPVVREFFGENLARDLVAKGKSADLVIGNNVYAHVPDINDFTRGIAVLLKEEGVVTLEFPHLLRLLEKIQFDTVYHEHYSYLSLYTVQRIFSAAGLRVFDVEELPTHGGSLRIYGCLENAPYDFGQRVGEVLEVEQKFGLQSLVPYQLFQRQADTLKNDLLVWLIEQKRLGKSVGAYGAAAKGNTLLNYAGVKPDLLPWVCDAAPSKQGQFMPGSHIPIFSHEYVRSARPDYLLIMPWNIGAEVKAQNSFIRDWGGRFVTAVPFLEID